MVLFCACGCFIEPFRGYFIPQSLEMGWKWFNKLLSSVCLVWTAYFPVQSCLWFSNTFTGCVPVKLLPASFCQFTHIPQPKSVIQRWDIKSQHSQWGFCKSTQNVFTDSQSLLGYKFYKGFFKILSVFFACYQGQCLKSSAIFHAQAGCSLLQVELGCSLRLWSFHHRLLLMLCILWPVQYLDISQLTNQCN